MSNVNRRGTRGNKKPLFCFTNINNNTVCINIHNLFFLNTFRVGELLLPWEIFPIQQLPGKSFPVPASWIPVLYWGLSLLRGFPVSTLEDTGKYTAVVVVAVFRKPAATSSKQQIYIGQYNHFNNSDSPPAEHVAVMQYCWRWLIHSAGLRKHSKREKSQILCACRIQVYYRF